MKRVAIIGAGQAGLLLGIGLVKNNVDTTIFSDKTPEQVFTGPILSSQGMFNCALKIEKELGVDFWDGYCPNNQAIRLNVVSETFGSPAISWQGYVDHPFQSIDQRVKFFKWMKEFKRLGGHLNFTQVGLKELEKISLQYDLVIVATGKGELRTIFEIDQDKTIFNEPARALSLLYVKGMEPHPISGLSANIIPGIGEYFTMPGLTKNGYCEMMLMEGVINGELDCWDDVLDPQEQLKKNLSILNKYLPWEAKRCQNLTLADSKAFLKGKYTPQVRKPIAELASGQFVLGMGDAVVLNDPIAGQGSNNAAKCAKIYLNRILQHLDKEFDPLWMQITFEEYWEDVQWSTQWTNMLLPPLEPPLIKILAAAEHNQDLANFLCNGFNKPSSFFPWVESETEADRLLNKFNNVGDKGSIERFSDKSILDQKDYFQLLKEKNEAWLKRYEQSQLMKFITSEKVNDEVYRVMLLDGIQALSNYFQKSVMLRHLLTDHRRFNNVTQQHFDEEINHNLDLLRDRGYLPPIWDPILESTMAWFCWKNLVLDRTEKTVLMHLVLETSANVFFEAADVVMQKFNETSYFKIHNDHDAGHADMGWELLKGLRDEDYFHLFKIQDEGWEMMITACNRVAELCLSDSSSKKPESHKNKTAEISES